MWWQPLADQWHRAMYVASLGVAALLVAIVVLFVALREWKLAALTVLFLALLLGEILAHRRRTRRRWHELSGS